MTAQAIADLLGARSAGAGKWQARCPAHQDRSPSLSIMEGREGRTLLRCWAGCRTETVLDAIGLRMGDLFAGPPPSAADLREIAGKEAARQVAARERRIAHGRACETMLKFERVVNELGGRLARLPEHVIDSPIERLFHDAIRKWRDSESLERKLRA